MTPGRSSARASRPNAAGAVGEEAPARISEAAPRLRGRDVASEAGMRAQGECRSVRSVAHVILPRCSRDISKAIWVLDSVGLVERVELGYRRGSRRGPGDRPLPRTGGRSSSLKREGHGLAHARADDAVDEHAAAGDVGGPVLGSPSVHRHRERQLQRKRHGRADVLASPQEWGLPRWAKRTISCMSEGRRPSCRGGRAARDAVVVDEIDHRRGPL